MKTLVESLFDKDLVTKPIDITTLDIAKNIITASLSTALKTNTIFLDENSNSSTFDKIWNKPCSFVCAQEHEGNKLKKLYIYLQYNIAYKNIKINIRFYIDVCDVKGSINLLQLGCNIYINNLLNFWADFSGGREFKKYCKLSSISFDDSTEELLNFIIKKFVKFQKSVDQHSWDEILENVYFKETSVAHLTFENIVQKMLNEKITELVK